jgi:crotonobetainyl-CoA:carnitine CoA-transferase CaiB-like acyl-CoA transferase/citrate lyase beta subunit
MNTEISSYQPDARCPLDGLRVLDLSRLVAGNMASLQLADFGAEVIKLEPPDGDPLRHWKTKGVSAYWKVYSRNKKSIVIDLKTAAGKDLFSNLLPTADVLIESFRPGVMEAIGFGPERVHEINPRVIFLRVSGWGQSGPYRSKPGFGSLAEAMSGFASKNGFADRPPALPNMALADMIAGLYGAFAVLVARREQERSGLGQVIDLSLLEPLHAILGPDAADYSLTGVVPPRSGNRASLTAPRNVYPTSDGKWLALSASMQSMAERLFQAIGRPDLINDSKFKSNANRLQNVDELDALMRGFIQQRTLNDNLQFFEEAQVTVGPVYDVSQFQEDAHVRERGILVDVQDAEMGVLRMPAPVPRLSRTPAALRKAAPRLGEDQPEILRRLAKKAPDPSEQQPELDQHQPSRKPLLRRSLLYVPALAERFIKRAHERGAASIALDLEDSILPEQKQAARDALASAIEILRSRQVDLWVRVNNHPAHLEQDLSAAVKSGVTGILLPKVKGQDDLNRVSALIDQLETSQQLEPGSVGLAALLETPQGVMSAERLLSVKRLKALCFGPEDYSASLGLEPTLRVLSYAAYKVALAARSADLEAWGPAGTITEVRNLSRFRRTVQMSIAMGFTGCFCVHPDQVKVVNQAYEPTEKQVAWARAVVAAFGDAGAIVVDGRMVDEPVYRRALDILNRLPASR